MKTEDLISNLSQELRPTKGADSLSRFLLKGLGVFFLMALLVYGLLPVRADFSLQLENHSFSIETFLWFLTGLLSGIVAYRLSIPGLASRFFSVLASLSILALVALIPFGNNLPASTFSEEMNLTRGICGGLIALISVLGSLFFFKWSSSHAPTKAGVTGFWIVLSTSCLGSTFMQIVCAHDSSLHLYLWHVLPTALLSALGMIVGKKILHW